jgi:hypothetical protein
VGCSDDTAAGDTDAGETGDATTVANTVTPTGGPGTQGSDTSSSDSEPTSGSDSSTGGPPVGPACRDQPDADRSGTRRWEDTMGTAEVTIDDPDAQRRGYTLSTTATLVDGLPGNPRTLLEQDGV